jgi:hypothetical protein
LIEARALLFTRYSLDALLAGLLADLVAGHEKEHMQIWFAVSPIHHGQRSRTFLVTSPGLIVQLHVFEVGSKGLERMVQHLGVPSSACLNPASTVSVFDSILDLQAALVERWLIQRWLATATTAA